MSTIIKNQNLEIEHPNGFSKFHGIQKIQKDSYYLLKFSNGKELKCSLDHPLDTCNGIMKAKDLSIDLDEILTKTGGCFLIDKILIEEPIELFDVIDSSPSHLYYTNDLVSHNCEFLGSSNTLISGTKLKQLTHDVPIYSKDGLEVWDEPKTDNMIDEHGMTVLSPRKYILACDTAEGKQLDFSAFVVVDITDFPYKLVARYRSNQIAPMAFPHVIYETARRFNNAFLLIAVDDVGAQVANILHYDLEYENIFTCVTKGRAGQTLSAGFSKNIQFGVKTTPPVKRIGCSNLKTFIETNKLIIKDFETVSELSTYINLGQEKFGADEGYHDDIVSCLVIFAWVAQQKYFKELTRSDVRKQLRSDFEEQLKHDLIPFGFLNNGLNPTFEVEKNKDIWFPVGNFMEVF